MSVVTVAIVETLATTVGIGLFALACLLSIYSKHFKYKTIVVVLFSMVAWLIIVGISLYGKKLL